jgi:GDPmannose 4,6-dehydratase
MFGDSRSWRETNPELITEGYNNPEVIGEYYQDENTPFAPRSPYAVAKLAAHHTTKMYREAYNIFACNGILFNHESERRGDNFVTRKITKYIAKLYQHLINGHSLHIAPKLELGNLNAKRDWGYAGDFVEAMWLMLQQDKADDYVIATGETHSVQDFLDTAFDIAIGLNAENFISINTELYRPTEVHYLCGNPSKAKRLLKWYPRTSFKELVQLMVYHDVNEVCPFQGKLVPAWQGMAYAV